MKRYQLGVTDGLSPFLYCAQDQTEIDDFEVEVYLSSEVDSALAAKDAEIQRLEALVRNNPLGDAHDMLHANWKFAQQEIERHKRAVDWLKAQLCFQERRGVQCAFNWLKYQMVPVPDDLADIISPAAAVGQDGRE